MTDYGGGDDGPVTGINVTPMVDIMLVLLIVFMVTATFVSEAALKVNLPSAANAAPAQERSALVTIGADGAVYLGEKRVAPETLGTLLISNYGAGARLSVAADKSVPYASVVQVLDAAKGAGITRVSLVASK